uniref:DDE-1 domain-containing protein n=1 Tax=Paramormyrops kingsleyae TaxID=1676925 RepID=A0A3B3QNZ7_9TELE
IHIYFKIRGHASEKKKRKAITLEQKLKLINEHEAGKAVIVIARDHHLSRRILEVIKASALVHCTTITRKRVGPLEEMEQLLVTWMEDQIQKCIPLSLLTIQAKAHTLFSDVKKRFDNPTYKQEFTASHGCGEAESADVEEADKFKEKLHKIIVGENYLPKHVFNVDETGLYWEQMPEQTYIHKEATTMPKFKAIKDRLTLLLGGNVSGYKLKALANISKNTLPVYYQQTNKQIYFSWMTAAIFEDWFMNCIIPEVKEYCIENSIPFKILLIFENAPGHPQYIGDANPNVRGVFLPPNTTSLIQSMDQGTMATFKAVDVTEDKELQTFWKDVQCHTEHSKSMEGDDKRIYEQNLEKSIKSVYCVTRGSLEIELIDVHDSELTSEELIELAEERKRTSTLAQETEGKILFPLPLVGSGVHKMSLTVRLIT